MRNVLIVEDYSMVAMINTSYMKNTKRVKGDLYYGNVGRPEYKYTFLK